MRPISISSLVNASTIRDDLLFNEPQERKCRDCGTLFNTIAKSRHLCKSCLNRVNSETNRVETYDVPNQFRGFTANPKLIQALRENPLLLLRGPTGTGKTGQAHHLLSKFAYSSKHAQFVQSGSLGRMSFEGNLPFDVKNIAIDDIGRTQTAGVVEALNALIDYRASKGLVTIFTTNLTLEEFEEVDPRLASRLNLFTCVPIGGVDRRKS